ncbi:MAG: glycosyltransferase, TIGR04372 family protein [Zetaproteobacteria bacterium CG06_land_8_20_14_3_00_59_53]|nr:MAG: glycosyltransferase, TIGR04372 family protein [Zetaproteobacteria bacterium CG23_combo_of_CG06-09_8_20_14_all_59_86]PIQ64269.1 MAG: glycosyltransferase, TIGR04372 family protein [Zetaproteobacteria bacterium CG11_big_fil_rev_8_21_14_0_20_59_439]PIU70385.1 MAG: glycosyltransferase, TIGR04372 family protein [Zetaproteobacteria bacterium CG06_land_8_20_14_3_00_59_53]PIU97491.1 MAG: glycosyltransferase, TIGR04372 family protein [Zetaproteobacteria bacterium CG03_land_8_20_14_0_80_59_51]PIY4
MSKVTTLRTLIRNQVLRFTRAWPIFVGHVKRGDLKGIHYIFRKTSQLFLNVVLAPLALVLVLVMRAARPWFLVRIGMLTSNRMGHFAANTELYLCERDAGINVPEGRYVDLWCHNWPICNQQLARMWGRVLHIGPRWLLSAIMAMNDFVSGGDVHRIGNNTSDDRDVHNLLERFPSHLSFLPEEEGRGETGLRALGVPEGAPFVCLLVRDSSYLNRSAPWRVWRYHNYRDCDVQNYVAASRALVERGYYVIRMGVVVNEAMDVDHPMIIDYAANGMRSDFMDIYLGAKCAFCISNASGFDAVPYAFRRPIVYVDQVPLGYILTFSSNLLATTKKHWLRDEGRFMTFREIFETGAAYTCFTGQFENLGIELFESTPEEITAVVLEMEERQRGSWQTSKNDEELQRRFWEVFPKNELHGEIRSFFGTDYLRRHKDWLQ